MTTEFARAENRVNRANPALRHISVIIGTIKGNYANPKTCSDLQLCQ